MNDDLITVGKVTGHYGVRGWVKVFSYTQPMDNIISYSTWIVGGQQFKGIKAKKHGKTIVALFKGCDNREKAQMFLGAEIQIQSAELRALGQDEFYWRQLIGMTVVNNQDETLGHIDTLFETGANDVIVVKDDLGEELLIPYVLGEQVISVDVKKMIMKVDWEVND